jgi:cytochrome P450
MMLSIFSDDVRRDPFKAYAQIRNHSPVFLEPQTGLWMVFDYSGVKRMLTDQEVFSSRHGPAEWMIFTDPPRHTKLRALISQAFTPRSITNLEPRIRELVQSLLAAVIDHGEMDLAEDFSIPLPMMVISEMLGIPAEDRPQFQRWNDIILDMSYTVPGGVGETRVIDEFRKATVEMNEYLGRLLLQRKSDPKDDLLTRLLHAEVEGERLTQNEILGFFQLLLLAGSETTTNLLNNAILCFIEYPDQLAKLRATPDLLPSAIEEVLRYRSPLQWMFRLTKSDVEMHGQTIPAGKVVLAVMGAANHDPAQFVDPERFDITRNPNPHLAFGHGLHFCLGAALARVESRIALTELLRGMKKIHLASKEPWQPRRGLHVMGPTRLPIRFEKAV